MEEEAEEDFNKSRWRLSYERERKKEEINNITMHEKATGTNFASFLTKYLIHT